MKTLRSLAGLAATLAILAGVPVHAQEVEGPDVTWRIATTGKPRTGTVHLETLKSYVEEKTDGNFEIILGYGTLGEPRDFLDLLKVGAVQGATVQPSLSGDRLSLYSVLDLPFLPLQNLSTYRAVHEAVHQNPDVLAEFANWNAIPYMSSLLPQYELMGTNETPDALSDIEGMRVRALGGTGAALEKLGAVPVNMPASEVYVALERGLLDGVAFPYYAHVSFRSYELGKWMSTNLAIGTTAFPVVFAKSAWEELPEQYRALLTEAREVAYDELRAAIEADDVKSLQTIRDGGVETIEFGRDDLDAFREIGGKPVWDEWVAAREAAGQPGEQILDLVFETAGTGN